MVTSARRAWASARRLNSSMDRSRLSSGSRNAGAAVGTSVIASVYEALMTISRQGPGVSRRNGAASGLPARQQGSTMASARRRDAHEIGAQRAADELQAHRAAFARLLPGRLVHALVHRPRHGAGRDVGADHDQPEAAVGI